MTELHPDRFHAPGGKADETMRHHLAHHCADVAACFESIVSATVLQNRLERAAGRALSPTDLSRLAVLAFLHDCGKLHPGFQAKAGWPENVWARRDWRGHVREGAAIFANARNGEIARNLHVDKLAQWGVDGDLLYAVLAHHGRPVRPDEAALKLWCAVPALGYDPLGASAAIGALLPNWFEAAFADGGAPLPNAAEFQHLLCGLVSLVDWLGSMQEVFTFVPDLDPAYIEVARRKARKVTADIGLDCARWRDAVQGRATFSTLAPGKPARVIQRCVGEWPIHDQLVVLEAETGSGKTEAALWHFARLFEAGLVDSLYFALPTRAAARQIHDRVDEAMKHLFGRGAPEAVLAVPGYLKSGETEGQALPDFRVLWDDDNSESTRLARWAAENAKRYLAATVAVGTVDQAMLSALQVKHAHLRAAALSRALVVIDEVHASDRYMTEVQSHLLATHLGYGGHAMLMSATLGSAARARWLGGVRVKPPPFEEAVATPYPAVWSGRQQAPATVASQNREKRVAMTLASSWEPHEAAVHAVAAADKGARVLVIRNTVAAALETFEAVRRTGDERLLWKVADGPALHHSRFAPEDRRLLDEAVESVLPPRQRASGGVIVIGTQTLEQSLDIDADLLVTDLCPADVLLQRIGRLHRHDLRRPAGYETPRCVVLTPEAGLARLAAPAFENGLGMLRDGGGVYRNLHACELTRRLVLDHPEWVIPAMNRLLVESATHPDRIDTLSGEMGKAWEDYWNAIYGKDIAEAGAARHVALPVETQFADVLFVSDEEKIRTRLGGEGAIVRFAEPVEGPFGQEIGSVTLPAHWSKGIKAEEPVHPVVGERCMIFTVDKNRFHYSREGLKRGQRHGESVQSSW